MGLHDPFARLGWLDSLESTVARLGFQSPLVEYRDGLVVAHFADAPLGLHHQNVHVEQQTKDGQDCQHSLGWRLSRS